jgi:hypothetical protein
MDAPNLVTRFRLNGWILGEHLPLLDYRVYFYHHVPQILPFSHIIQMRMGLPTPPEPLLCALADMRKAQELLDCDLTFTWMGPLHQRAYLIWYSWTAEPGDESVELHIAVPDTE